MKTMLFIIVAFFALMILPAIAGYVMNTQWFLELSNNEVHYEN